MDDNTKGRSKLKITKESLLRSPTLMIIVPMIIGLQLGWVYMRQKYVPPEERHKHPLLDPILKFIPSKE